MSNVARIFWRAEVYTESDTMPGQTMTRKLFAGIYATRGAAQDAAERLCEQVKGFGFYVHALKSETLRKLKS